jgi:hypothetical protein
MKNIRYPGLFYWKVLASYPPRKFISIQQFWLSYNFIDVRPPRTDIIPLEFHPILTIPYSENVKINNIVGILKINLKCRDILLSRILSIFSIVR